MNQDVADSPVNETGSNGQSDPSPMTDQTAADIVERLRHVVPYQGKSATAFLCHEAATEIEALRAREAELETALEEADRKNDALTAEWNDTQRKLDEAVKALERFETPPLYVFDDPDNLFVPASLPAGWIGGGIVSGEDYRAVQSALASIRGEG